MVDPTVTVGEVSDNISFIFFFTWPMVSVAYIIVGPLQF